MGYLNVRSVIHTYIDIHNRGLIKDYLHVIGRIGINNVGQSCSLTYL